MCSMTGEMYDNVIAIWLSCGCSSQYQRSRHSRCISWIYHNNSREQRILITFAAAAKSECCQACVLGGAPDTFQRINSILQASGIADCWLHSSTAHFRHVTQTYQLLTFHIPVITEVISFSLTVSLAIDNDHAITRIKDIDESYTLTPGGNAVSWANVGYGWEGYGVEVRVNSKFVEPTGQVIKTCSLPREDICSCRYSNGGVRTLALYSLLVLLGRCSS